MEIAKLNVKSDENLVVYSNATKTSRKKKILSEEDYTEKMEEIITRDFFPDLPKLQVQNAFLEAAERGDVTKMQQLKTTFQLSESTRSRICSIREPVITCETPNNNVSPLRNISESEDALLFEQKKTKETLDEFLSNATSEDNASFQKVMEKSQQQHKEKHPWLYKDEQSESFNILALPSSQSQEAIEGGKSEVATWAYKNRNALMYVPDGVELTTEEKLAATTNRKEISHVNSRFESAPFDEKANREAIAEAASLQAKMQEGRVGIDGKELLPSESPQVNGFGFVATPLPQPGVSDTPIMTWGEIEGTPFRLDGGDTPLPQTPSSQQFRIPNISARERIALSLADKAAKKHRKQKKTELSSSSSKFGSSTPLTPLERLQGMSPAARKLACAKLGIQQCSDRALRASYSPSPLRTPNSRITPLHTPNVTPSPKPSAKTPTLTDTLLNVPKRHKAMDFF